MCLKLRNVAVFWRPVNSQPAIWIKNVKSAKGGGNTATKCKRYQNWTKITKGSGQEVGTTSFKYLGPPFPPSSPTSSLKLSLFPFVLPAFLPSCACKAVCWLSQSKDEGKKEALALGKEGISLNVDGVPGSYPWFAYWKEKSDKVAKKCWLFTPQITRSASGTNLSALIDFLSYTWWPNYLTCFVCVTLTWQRIENTERDGTGTSLLSLFLNRYAFKSDLFTLQFCNFNSEPLKAECDGLHLNPITAATVCYRQHTIHSWTTAAARVASGFFPAFDSPTHKVNFLSWFTQPNFLESKSSLSEIKKRLPLSSKALQLSPVRLYVYTAIHHPMLNGIPQT